jgi:sigma-B regulation protein RsbU (phosphoserine phosphatase)
VADYCDETGGDYFDFLDIEPLDDQHLGIALGDVTGHGIAAALLMCTGRALLRSGAGRDGTLAELFAHINDHLCAAGFQGRFMTLFYLTIQREPLVVRYISAGHDPTLVYDPDTDTFSELAGADVPLGVTEGWEFNEFCREGLPPRAVLVLGTDGIWEARNPQDQMYGKDRWKQIIREHHAQPAADLCNRILQDVARFRAGREQLDDITLVVIKRDA